MRKWVGVISLLIICTVSVISQTAPNKYWIQFTDKNHNPYTLDNPEEFLSDKAIQRRINQNIPFNDLDIPVTPFYIDSLKNLGITVLTQSKWMNGVTIYLEDTLLLDQVSQFSFVQGIEKSAPLKHGIDTTKRIRDLAPIVQEYIKSENPFGFAFDQIKIHNGDKLHEKGYRGKGITIAVIDAGFRNVDRLSPFDSLWINNRIIGTRDFVEGGELTFKTATHGTSVLSTMAANVPGSYVGTAPEASYWLIRSEDARTEYIIEEDNWIAAAEFADSVGVDVINTSLGYSEFDDPKQNHTYKEMDGKSTRISIGADIAVSKGMLMICSAGNKGDDDWNYITAPADAFHVFTVGAVDIEGLYALFSSKGPTYDGRVKPNVASVGSFTYVLSFTGTFNQANGTSYASPIIAGLTACLWQANPSATNFEIMKAIEKSSTQYYNPDSLIGYGIPNFLLADTILKMKNKTEEKNQAIIEPNPFSTHFTVSIPNYTEEEIVIEIIDIDGKKHITKKDYLDALNDIYISGLDKLDSGLYIINISSDVFNERIKILKQ